MQIAVTRRRLLELVAALGLLALLPKQSLAQAPVPGGTLRMWSQEPQVLTNAATSSGIVFNITNKIFDGLVDFDFDFNPVPKLAESWEISDDGLTLTFNLRPGVTWHDGTPFTSADVAFSATEAWQKLHPRGRSTWANLQSVDTPDDLTVIFRLSKPAPYIMNALFGAELQIIPKHIYEGTDILNNPANTAPIGTGPFRFSEWRRGEYIYLEKYADYWDAPRPYLDGIVLQFIPDPSARAIALEAQELDIAGALPVPLNDAMRLKALPYLEIPERGGEAYSQFVFMDIDTRKAPFDDVRVRRAIYHAIDREFIAREIFFGLGTPATGPIPRTQIKFYSDDVPQYAYDLEKAKQLLDEANLMPGADGVRFRMTFDPIPGFADFMPLIASYFKSQMALIGIEVDIRSEDLTGYVDRVYNKNEFDMAMSSLTGMSDPTIGIQQLYWSKNIRPGTAFSNASGYSSPEADAALEAAQTEMNEQKRREDFIAFQRQVMTDLPSLPLLDVQYFTVINRRVHGYDVTPYGISGNFADIFLVES